MKDGGEWVLLDVFWKNSDLEEILSSRWPERRSVAVGRILLSPTEKHPLGEDCESDRMTHRQYTPK
jgi:hypothetical protein